MRILLINLPPYLPKKSQNQLYYLQASMNLGMLAVASAAERQGHTVQVYDWLGPQHYPLMARLPETLGEFAPDVVGFSVPSGYAEPYLAPFSKAVKEHRPLAHVTVGGQYHAGFRASAILDVHQCIDSVVTGPGEPLDWDALVTGSHTASVQGVLRRNGQSAARISAGGLHSLDWSLHALNLKDYAPSIEIGRGCPFTCSFCSLSGAPERLSRSAVDLIRFQLAFWTELWEDLKTVPLYAECPVFFCNERNLNDFREAFEPFSSQVEWRVQARVDSIRPSVFPELYRLGLRVIDLGLESASPRMLGLMEKTADPSRYLEKATIFIEAAADAGIGVKLNILLYPGEDDASMSQTEDFVLRNASRIAGIAAGSTIEFPGTSLGEQLPQLSERFGTSRVFDEQLASAGIYPLNLTRSLSFEQARDWCIRLSRKVMTMESYFNLKRIGYYSPSVSFNDFQAAVAAAPFEGLPFTTLESESPRHERRDLNEAVVGWDKLR